MSFLSNGINFVDGGYVLLATNYMRNYVTFRSPQVDLANRSMSPSLPIISMLRSIIRGQEAALSHFIRYLSSIGLKGVDTSAQGIKDLSDQLRMALNNYSRIANFANEDVRNRLNDIQTNIDQTIRERNFIKVFEDNLSALILQNVKKDTATITQAMLKDAFTKTREQLVLQFLPNLHQIVNSEMDAEAITRKLNTYLPLNLFFNEENFNNFTEGKFKTDILNKRNGMKKAIKETLGKEMTSRYVPWEIQEYIEAFFLDSIGAASTKQTGRDKTRKTTYNQIVTSELATGEEIRKVIQVDGMAQDKDDAFATFKIKLDELNKEMNLRVHISAKFRHIFQGRDYDINDSKISNQIFGMDLESKGGMPSKYLMLERVFAESGMSNQLKSLRFAINNMANDSLLRGSSNKDSLEKQLSSLFSAFMFNATFKDMTADDLLGSNASFSNADLYILDVNGFYFTLGEICEQYIQKILYLDMDSLVKVNISPATTNFVSRNGKYVVGFHPLKGFSGYSQGDW